MNYIKIIFVRHHLLFLIVLSTLAPIAKSEEFRLIPSETLAIISTTEGKIYVELSPDFAPRHVKRFTSLATKGLYNDTAFYRVIEGFVAQGGPADSDLVKDLTALKLESELSTENLNYSVVQEQDLFAPFTGFTSGFAIGLNKDKSQSWLLHCPGTVAFARGNEADSATSDFYITIGQAPRYLDKIMTIFGRVVFGMDVVQRIKRAPYDSGGIFEDSTKASQILSIILSSELPEAKRPVISIEKTEGAAFTEKLKNRKYRSHPFFFEKPPAVLDACQVPLKVKMD